MQLVLALVASLVPWQALADLPVHCVRHQLIGEWTFHLGPPSARRLDCGHQHPDSQTAQPGVSILGNVSSLRSVSVVLKEPNEAIVQGEPGNWTTIYDEGFEVDGAGLEFFAFSKFKLLPSEMRTFGGQTVVMSECGRTEIGWYRESSKNQWGCYYGVLKPSKGQKFSAIEQAQQTFRPVPTSRSYDQALSKAEVEAVANSLNKRADASWTARAYPRFFGKTPRQLNSLSGIQREAVSHAGLPRTALHTAATQSVVAVVQQSKRGNRLRARHLRADEDEENITGAGHGLPKTFDWRNVNGSNWLMDSMDQGDCGSCYVISTMHMLTVRHRIAKRNATEEPFSVGFPLRCSEYNQGCQGGYPYLVSKWAKDVGVLPESCSAYGTADLGSVDRCSLTCDQASAKRFKVGSFGYIGGYYGAGDEEAMMKELHESGPLVVSMEPGPDFMYYGGGVYKSDNKLPLHAEWVRVDHSILLVGWGEETQKNGKKLKYWVVQNSWGADWGEQGFFRIERGENDSGIESEPLFADVAEVTPALDIPFAVV
eukprot:gnl/TRDRNA2_/TRDRNA2_114261_c0_seq1.p1 gnl/TRDRNA2_/TRDRNA2_114261_c0~~gnl/TRDRNA2_/TRDRNA2_114261_c0_seq1.p1  ORF type:complete len:540 (+),score=91.81 gnl/TRDRNA2_/TRDRNA2_114261_c0_seq1:138-1757(+)